MLYIQAEKAMYLVLRQGRYHNISIQCQLKLFDINGKKYVTSF